MSHCDMIVRHARIIGEEQWPRRIRERLTETSQLNGRERIYPILPRERSNLFNDPSSSQI